MKDTLFFALKSKVTGTFDFFIEKRRRKAKNDQSDFPNKAR